MKICNLPLASLFCALAGVASAASVGVQDGAPALEPLLAKMREQRDAALELHAESVARSMAELEGLGSRSALKDYEALVHELRSLSDVAVPLYVRYLEPRLLPADQSDSASAPEEVPGPKPGQIFRSREVAALLETLPTRCVRSELIELAKSGTKYGRANAVQVLAGFDQDRDVADLLESIFEGETGSLKYAALRSLSSLGGERSLEILRTTLSQNDRDLLRSALEALSDGRVGAASDEVLELAQDTRRASAVARALAGYYAACPDRFDAEAAVAMFEIVRSRKAATEERVAVLRSLRALDSPSTSEVRSVLRAIANESAGSSVAEEALISLALMSDSKARRRVLEPYDKRIKKNPEWAQAFRDRGSIQMRLRDYRAAQRDFRDAIEILSDKNQATRDVWVLLARSHALDGRLKNAAEDLRSAVLSVAELNELRNDPDFAELAASRYGKIFGSND